jgi:hypothetical protein
MASISIPWNDGPGNIVLTYTGQGNNTVVISSDTNNYEGRQRSQQVTFVVKDGAIRDELASGSGHILRSSDGHTLLALDNAMKVTVTVVQLKSSKHVLVTANNYVVVSASGNIIRTSTNT